MTESELTQEYQHINESIVLAKEYGIIADHFFLGSPLNEKNQSYIRSEETHTILNEAITNGICIINGPSRWGKTSSAMLAIGEYLANGGTSMFIDCSNPIWIDTIGENGRKMGFATETMDQLFADMGNERCLMVIDELSTIIDPKAKDGQEHKDFQFLSNMLVSLGKHNVPKILIIHEKPNRWEYIQQHLPQIAKAKRIIPAKPTDEEITHRAIHGSVYKRGEPLFTPELYKGITKEALADVVRITGRRILFIDRLLHYFSESQSLNFKVHKTPPVDQLTQSALRATLQQNRENFLNEYYIESVGSEIIQKLEDINGLEEFLTAFKLHPTNEPFSFENLPFQAPKNALLEKTVQTLTSLQVIEDRGDAWEIDGLILAYGIMKAVASKS